MDTKILPGIKSIADDTDFAMFMKWFEVLAEDTIFERNTYRRNILTETIERISSLQQIQKKNESKTDEKSSTLSNAKRIRMEETSKNVELPDEVLLKILNYMETKDVFGSFALVCKRFNNLTKDPNAIRFLHVGEVTKDEHLDKIVEVIQRSKKLHEFKMKISYRREGFYEEKVIQSVLSPELNVKMLKIQLHEYARRDYTSLFASQGRQLEGLELNKYSNSISRLSNLKSLKMSRHSVFSKCEDLVDIAKSCSYLENIHFDEIADPHWCSKMSYTLNCALGRGFHDFFLLRKDSLKSVTFENFDGLSDLDCPRFQYRRGKREPSFLKNMSLCANLEELKILDASFLLDEGMRIISNLPKLKRLDLTNLGNLTYNENDKIMELSDAPSRIERRDEFLQVKPKSIDVLFSKLNTHKLKFLSITYCDIITDEDIETLAKKDCPKLEQLVLDRCPNLKLKNCTLKNLIKNCPSLQSIQLHWRMITDISTNLWNELRKRVNIHITLGKSCMAIEEFVVTKAK